MEKMKISYFVVAFSGEPIETSIDRIARYGYDGVEIPGEPGTIDARKVRRLVEEHGLGVSAIVGMFPRDSGRDLISSDPAVQRGAIDYHKAVIDMACELGTEVIAFNPSVNLKIQPEVSLEREWKWAVERTRKICEYAARMSSSLKLAIEPWCRFETYFINRLDEALRLKKDIGMDNVAVMADWFHMNIEETSMENAMRRCGKDLVHVHDGDSSRAGPGKGHLNFPSLLNALKEIGYERYLVLGYPLAKPEAYWGEVARSKKDLYEAQTREAIKFVRRVLAEIGG